MKMKESKTFLAIVDLLNNIFLGLPVKETFAPEIEAIVGTSFHDLSIASNHITFLIEDNINLIEDSIK